MTAILPLAKGYDENKIQYPGYLSYKLDGVPVRLDLLIREDRPAEIAVRTRQNEIVHSTANQVGEFVTGLLETGLLGEGNSAHTFLFEVTHKKLTAFKDAAGVIRRQSPQEDLLLNMFDYHNHACPDVPFETRRIVQVAVGMHLALPDYKVLHQYTVDDQAEFDYKRARMLELRPNCEGLVYRAADAVWCPGKRRLDYMRVLQEPTADVEVVRFEEAVNAKTGEGKGMVGRINIRWKDGKVHGVGPGKLTHTERKDLWTMHELKNCDPANSAQTGVWPDRLEHKLIAQIKYKKDDTYKGPRQGTFQHWRPEKTEPSYE